jgi:cell division protein FtsB
MDSENKYQSSNEPIGINKLLTDRIDYSEQSSELTQLKAEITRLQEKYDENGYDVSPMIKLKRIESTIDSVIDTYYKDNEVLKAENERLKANLFTLEDIERAFNVGVISQFELEALDRTDTIDFHARKLHQLVESLTHKERC